MKQANRSYAAPSEEDNTALFPIAISPGDDQHAWGVEVPDIPGCFCAGNDLDDALAMAREAIEGHMELLAEDGVTIPVAQSITFHSSNPDFADCIWALVRVGHAGLQHLRISSFFAKQTAWIGHVHVYHRVALLKSMDRNQANT